MSWMESTAEGDWLVPPKVEAMAQHADRAAASLRAGWGDRAPTPERDDVTLHLVVELRVPGSFVAAVERMARRVRRLWV